MSLLESAVAVTRVGSHPFYPLEVTALQEAMPLSCAKRTLDILISLVALIMLSPLLLLVALLIKFTDDGPILYIQRRVGLGGTPFKLYKFRSMVVNAHYLRNTVFHQNRHRSGVTFKIIKDPRVTWIGRIIRKLSIDELPQLWNVIKGEMSLVGPRPPLPEEVAQYHPEHFRRLCVAPGITCLWQVQGRANLPFEDQFRLDLEYIRTRTFWRDLCILFLTIPAVLSCRGSY